MLLRRFMEHTRTQNWYAVVLDLLVVVLGIYIGLQVDAWANARKERVLERAHLEQIMSDATSNVEIARALSNHHAERDAEIRFAVGQLLEGDLLEENSDRFKWAIMMMKQVPPMSLETGGYQALIASGDFHLIRSKEIKNLLVRIHSLIDDDNTRVQIHKGNDFSDQLDDAFTTVRHPSGKGLYFKVDYDMLVSSNESLVVLSSWRRPHSILSESRGQISDLFAQLEQVISNYLGDAAQQG